MNYELLYTSAPQGLKPGSRGFCTVVATRGIPSNLTQKLESISGYRPLYPPSDARASNNPVCYSHVRFALASKNVSVISRVGAYGFDYSQRSNKIAYHIAVYENAPACGPVPLLKSPSVMRSKWDGQCRSLGSDPELPNLSLVPQVAQRWQEITGDAGWAGFVAANWLQTSAKPLWIVFGEDQSAQLLDLMLEATALLPAKARWSATFSTYFTNLPPDAECRVRCVLAGSEEAKAAKSRGSVLDLTAPMPPAIDSPEVQAAREGTVIGGPGVKVAPPPPRMKSKLEDSGLDLTAETLPTPTSSNVAEKTSEGAPPAVLPSRDPSQPPDLSERRPHRRSKATNGWPIFLLMAIGLAVVGGMVYTTVQAINQNKKVVGDLDKDDGPNIDANVFRKPIDEPQRDRATPRIDLRDGDQPIIAEKQPNPADDQMALQQPPQIETPRIDLLRLPDENPITDSIEFDETQMRGPLDVLRVRPFILYKAEIQDIDTELDKTNFVLQNDILHWKGESDFRAKPSNEGWPVKIMFNDGIEKKFTIVVKQVSDPDIVVKLKPTSESLGNILVAGIEIEAVCTVDLDETKDVEQRKELRRFLWERQEYKAASLPVPDQVSEEFRDSGIEAPTPSAAQENWKLIAGANSDRYVVTPEDYGHELHCIMFYREASGGEKRVLSKPIKCVSVPILEYLLADLFDKPPDKIMGTIQWDIAPFKAVVPANASWQLNANKIIPATDSNFAPFSLDTVIPQNTAPIKEWARSVQDSRRAVATTMAALHEMLMKGFRDAAIPPESELSQSYLNNTGVNIDALDYSKRLVPLNVLHRKVLKFGELAAIKQKNESQATEFDFLQKELVGSNIYYLSDPKLVSKELANPESRSDFLIRFYRVFEGRQEFKKRLGLKQSDALSALDALKKALAAPIELASIAENPLKISILVPVEGGLPGTSSEVASFPIAVKLKIARDERYSKLIASGPQ